MRRTTFSCKASATSTSSVPDGVRKLGGAVFGDKRFGRAFIYHNTADCYYASRGYRLKVVVN
ncbi:DUF4256 family protein [Limosilactobacillus fermentum]|nr:DUF4256 family protein [Limosilactobacillus fermentum]